MATGDSELYDDLGQTFQPDTSVFTPESENNMIRFLTKLRDNISNYISRRTAGDIVLKKLPMDEGWITLTNVTTPPEPTSPPIGWAWGLKT